MQDKIFVNDVAGFPDIQQAALWCVTNRSSLYRFSDENDNTLLTINHGKMGNLDDDWWESLESWEQETVIQVIADLQ